ncbi:hypothetical protein Tco_1053694 [Tanacetum coccineum]|uniref:Uncharacterized protein n=1 Tax=Tanacetum coccineum TaxID=301880 RepID=A0ABQ5GUM0_9ASTR
MANDHKWNDELTDGKLKEEALMHKARIEESQGDATPGVMKFCAWLKSSFENFHELDYDVLVKMEECWWKVNAHENAPFARWENHSQGPYANAKTKKDYDPYLDIYRNFGRNYGSNNAGYGYSRKGTKRKPKATNPSTEWKGQSQRYNLDVFPYFPPAKPLDTLAKIISSTLLFPPSCIKSMLAIPHLSQVSSMAEIDSKEAQKKSMAGIRALKSLTKETQERRAEDLALSINRRLCEPNLESRV